MQTPADVPSFLTTEFIENYNAITKNTENLFLFSVDQKLEHLNNDFYGETISSDSIYPENIFKIASKGKIGALASHLGLICRYGNQYNDINYIIKLNGKTNLITEEQSDPFSQELWCFEDVVNLKKNSNLKIRGIGYTIYLGSEYEAEMLQQAAQIVFNAHQNGLIAILWIYPRGKSIMDKTDLELAPGSTGVANSLGADFVKIKVPQKTSKLNPNQILDIAIKAAGNTKVICSGGEKRKIEDFLKDLENQIKVVGTNGCATGRNIFQRDTKEAIALTYAISSIVYEKKNFEEAINIYKSKLI